MNKLQLAEMNNPSHLCGCTTNELCEEAQALWRKTTGLWRQFKQATANGYWSRETREVWDKYIVAHRSYNDHRRILWREE